MFVCLNGDGIQCLIMQHATLDIWLLDFKVFEYNHVNLQISTQYKLYRLSQ